MNNPELIKFSFVFIVMGLLENIIFSEYFLGYPLLIIGFISIVTEIFEA
jgi:hypothetical protein